MDLDLVGRHTTSNHTEKVWSSFTIESLPTARCSVKHRMHFYKSRFSVEEQKKRKARIDVEMRESLEMLRFNFHSKLPGKKKE